MRTRCLYLTPLLLAASLAHSQTTPLVAPTEVITAPLEIAEGQTRDFTVAAPRLAPDQAPVLFIRARVPVGGGGGNFILRVLVDGAPLRDNWFAPRLLNKQPNFDPPGTQYHFQWYRDTSWGNFSYSWFTVFDANPKGNWAGTGQDYDYLLSLDGLVSGRTIKLTVEHTFLGLAAAMKAERAPLLVEKLTVGALPRAELERLQRAVLGGLDIKHAPAVAQVPAGETGVQAYELTWSGRPDPGLQVTFDRLDGWTVDYRSAGSVTLAASAAQRLWRPSVGKLILGPSDKPVAIALRPPQPIRLDGTFDSANFWVYGHLHFMDKNFTQINASALLADARGAETVVDLGPIRMGYWMLLHGAIPAQQRTRWQPPLHFKALQLTADKAKADYTLYLEGLHFYNGNRHPRPAGRPDKPVFPVTDRGNLPTPPAGVKTAAEQTPAGARFTSTAPTGTLVYEVDLGQGCTDGISARWNGGSPFRPCVGGGVLAADTKPLAGKLVSRRLAGGKLTAQWRAADGKEWSTDYALDGRSLIVNVHATRGWASGTAFGAVEGLPDVRAVEVPYLKFSRYGGMTPIAVGGGLFVSVVPDLYHSDYSNVEGVVAKPDQGRLQLFKQTVYTPLTNGRRNDLHDRLLITASPEFADVLPNHQNPRSPNLERLAPYMFVMNRALALNRWDTFKRYGMDHIIANDFAGIFVQSYSEGFGVRWRPHPDYTIQQVQEARARIKGLGFMFGAYIDVTDQPPLNEWWDENQISITATGDLAEAWPGSYCPKTDQMWVLARKTGQKMKELYPPDCVYLDVTTNRGTDAVDFEAGYPGAGMARAMVIGVGDSLVETRKWYGSTVSEGIYRWMYAGLSDMDYAQVRMSDGQPRLPLDFDLLKLHPYQIGTMMGYGPTCFLTDDEIKDLNGGTVPGPTAFYKYVGTSLAYGHMALLGYGYFPPISRCVQYYALMQGVQSEYLADTVAGIAYWDGAKFLPTSQALQSDAYRRGQVRVTYRGGLVVTANLNESENWTVTQGGKRHVLPPFGWVITGGKSGVTAYSALVDDKRMDYVQCPDYVYLNGGELARRVGPLEVQGAAWLKRDGKGWLLIPCGKLGHWSADLRVEQIPTDRGTPLLIVDLPALGLQGAQVTGLAEMGEAAAAQTEALADGRLKITTSDKVRAYRLQP